MSAVPAGHGRGRRLWGARPGVAAALVAAGALAVGLGLPFVLERVPESAARWLPLGLVGLGVLFVLVVTKPGAMVITGFVLLAFVRTEPAPVDIVFALLILSSLLWWRHPLHVPRLIEATLVLLAALMLLSLVNAEDAEAAIRFVFVSLYLFALAVWLTSVFADGTITRRCVIAYILVAAASAAVGVVALKIGFPGDRWFLYDTQRTQALFKDPNVFGPFLVPAAAIVLEEIGNPRLLRWRMATKLVVLLVLLAGLVFAFSRAAWLNFAIAAATVVLVYAWRRGGLRRAFRSALAIGLALLAGLGLLIATGSLDFFESRSSFKAYDVERFSTQGSAFAQATDHVLGYGPGQVEQTLDQSVHNLYLRVAYEQGVIGFLLLLVLLAATLYYALVLVARNRTVQGVGSAALLGSWLGLLANGGFIDTLHWRHLWIVAALIWAGYSLRNAPQTAPALEGSGVTQHGGRGSTGPFLEGGREPAARTP